MKKQWQTYFMAFVLAVYFLFAGMGWNLVRFCCAECEHAGIEQVAARSCGAIHHHSAPEALPSEGSADFACSDLKHHTEERCHLLRLVLDNTVLQQKQNVPSVAEFVVAADALAPDSFCNPFAFLAQDMLVCAFPESIFFCPPGKDLLPRICIWII